MNAGRRYAERGRDEEEEMKEEKKRKKKKLKF